MANRKPTSLEIAAEAVRQVDELKKKYRAERATVFAEILRRDPRGAEPSDEKVDAAANFQARVRERLNGHATLAGMPAATTTVGKLRRDLIELDFIIDRVLVGDEIAKKGALAAAYALDRAAEWLDDERTLAAALLQIKRLSRSMQRKQEEAIQATGLVRSGAVDWCPARFLEVEGLVYQVLADLVRAGVITEAENAAAGE